MIWLIIALIPVVVLVTCAFVHDWQAALITLAVVVGAIGWMLLLCYGGWQMGWFTHCGTFWESASC